MGIPSTVLRPHVLGTSQVIPMHGRVGVDGAYRPRPRPFPSGDLRWSLSCWR
jgi:hypothetical protein